MGKLFGNILKAINIVVVLVYLIGCLAPYLAAEKYWFVAMIGLVLPILMFIIFAFLIVWAFARSRWILLPVLALLLSWKQISVLVGFHAEKFDLAKSTDTLRVFTWNVSSWSQSNKVPLRIERPNQLMVNFINEQRPDILCFQEFYDRHSPKAPFSILERFKELGFPYSYFVTTSYLEHNFRSGVAIISRYPIIDTSRFYYGEGDYAAHLIYADIDVKGKKVRVFTTHLQSVRFEHAQYVSLRKIKQTDESGLKGSKTIVSKLKLGYYYRSSEADLVKQKVAESPYPVILCGDFNDVPTSYTYFTARGDLQDAFLKKGSKLGRTFRYLSPTLRIDYILADKKFKVEQFDRIVSPYSDHYPLMADLNISDLPSN